MKIRSVIVDDELYITKQMEHFIAKYCPSLEVVGVANTKKQASQLIKELEPQLLFLDIELDQGTSFELLDEIDQSNIKVLFVTAYHDYALKAIKYNAIDYIVKPVQIDELVSAVTKAYKEIERQEYTFRDQLTSISTTMLGSRKELNFIAVPSKKKVDFIRFNNILYLESQGRYTTFNLTENKSEVSVKNIGEYEKMLIDQPFFRIHNSYLINLMHVVSIDRAAGNYCMMNNGKMLPIAKRRMNELEHYINLK